jgi:hypothetical protein
MKQGLGIRVQPLQSASTIAARMKTRMRSRTATLLNSCTTQPVLAAKGLDMLCMEIVHVLSTCLLLPAV